MSITVTLYTFSKRENSTAQPSTGTDFYCVLKQPTSIINPTLELSATDITAYNYAYIAAFGRYYFMRDITSIANNLWQITLKVDVMATYKTNIGNSEEYVLRSSSNYDGDIVDNLYPTKGIIHRYANLSTGNPFDINDIGYVIGSINNETSNKFGAVQYYLTDSANLGTLMEYLLGVNLDSSTDLESLIVNLSVEIQNGIAKALSNPTQYIVDSYAVPYASKLDVDTSASIKTGYWITPASGAPLLNNYSFQIDSGTIDLGEHPQAATRGNYLNGAPFTRHWLCLGPFGMYPLDANQFINIHQVEYKVAGDQFGNVRCDISCQGARIDRLYANVKCPFPLAQVSVDAMGALQNAISAAAQVQSYYDDDGSQEGAANGIISFAKSLLPQVQRSGAQGTMSGIFGDFIAVTECYEVVDDDVSQRGRPLCQRKTINTLSGYILVSDPDISIPGTAEENAMIKQFMSTGFFYE